MILRVYVKACMQESLCRASFTAGSTRFAPQPPFPYINMTNAQSPPGGCPRYRNRSRAPPGRAGRGEGAGFGRSRLRRRPAQRKMMCRGGCARVVRRWWLAATENSSSLALWSWWIKSRGQMCNNSRCRWRQGKMTCNRPRVSEKTALRAKSL